MFRYLFCFYLLLLALLSFPTRRSSDLERTAPPGTPRPQPFARRKPARRCGAAPPPAAGLPRGAAAGSPRDRKSTRLNSSHLGISYAVFCLKKKSKDQIGTVARQPLQSD